MISYHVRQRYTCFLVPAIPHMGDIWLCMRDESELMSIENGIEEVIFIK